MTLFDAYKYSSIFKQITIITENRRIILNSAYKNHQTLYRNVINILATQ